MPGTRRLQHGFAAAQVLLSGKFPSRCRERGGCNMPSASHYPRIQPGFPSRCRERGGCNLAKRSHASSALSGFHPVAGNEAVATSRRHSQRADGSEFPSRCRERGGCNSILASGSRHFCTWFPSRCRERGGCNRQYRAAPLCTQVRFHPVAGNEAVATCRPPATIHAFSHGFHPVAGNEAVATWQNEATQAAL